jgi:hypothetical protein
VESETPSGSAGLVSCPYSVIQTGMFFRWNHESIEASNFGISGSTTFGKRAMEVGARFGRIGYGCCA